MSESEKAGGSVQALRRVRASVVASLRARWSWSFAWLGPQTLWSEHGSCNRARARLLARAGGRAA